MFYWLFLVFSICKLNDSTNSLLLFNNLKLCIIVQYTKANALKWKKKKNKASHRLSILFRSFISHIFCCRHKQFHMWEMKVVLRNAQSTISTLRYYLVRSFLMHRNKKKNRRSFFIATCCISVEILRYRILM